MISEKEAPVNQQAGGLFDTIESAHQYVQLLADVVSDVRKDLENETSCERRSQFPRRLDAVRLALYNLDKLQLLASERAGATVLAAKLGDMEDGL
jgi:hypothetical protein